MLFEKNGLQNFQKFVEDPPCGVCFGKYSVRTFLLRLKTYFLCFIHNFIISGLFEVFVPSFPKLIVSKSLFSIFLWWKVYDFLESLSFWEERVCLTFSQNVFPFCITIFLSSSSNCLQFLYCNFFDSILVKVVFKNDRLTAWWSLMPVSIVLISIGLFVNIKSMQLLVYDLKHALDLIRLKKLLSSKKFQFLICWLHVKDR